MTNTSKQRTKRWRANKAANVEVVHAHAPKVLLDSAVALDIMPPEDRHNPKKKDAALVEMARRFVQTELSKIGDASHVLAEVEEKISSENNQLPGMMPDAEGRNRPSGKIELVAGQRTQGNEAMKREANGSKTSPV